MPMYEYECAACGHRFERIQKFSDPPIEECPNCGERKVQKLLSSPAIQFKGTGWYITDYARKGAAGTDTKTPTDGARDSKGSRESGESKESRASKESGESRGPKESGESRGSKESGESRASKESSQASDSKSTTPASGTTSTAKASGE
jgi:putative FmdB family regulatory protein